jgi:hypothetical protein
MAVSEPMAQLYDGVNPDKPDPKLEAQAEALVKKHGFASLGEYDEVSMNIVTQSQFSSKKTSPLVLKHFDGLADGAGTGACRLVL